MDAGSYQTGFFITELNIDIELLNQYKEMAVQYIALSQFTQKFMTQKAVMSLDIDMQRKLKENFDSFLKPYKDAIEKIATFLHEYIHFLQDISTLTGLTIIDLCSKKIQTAMNIVAKSEGSEEKSIILPLQECSSKIIEACSNYYSIFRGSSSNLTFKKLHHYNRFYITSDECLEILSDEDPIMYPKDILESLHEIKVVFNDGKDEYQLGSYIISESMAYLFESTVFNAEKRNNQYPYNICEMIVNKECPAIAENRYLILAICELSLMHEHSGEMFYNIIEEIKEKKLSFKNVSEFEKYFLPRITHLSKSLEYKYQHSIIPDIDFLYPGIQQFNTLNHQIKHMISAGIRLRRSGLFIAKAAENSNRNGEINIWFEKCGIPLIIDSTNSTFSTTAFDNLSFSILCPKALDKLLFEHEKKCFMFNICQMQKESNVCFDKKICSQEPWTQTDKERICPLVTYLYHYSIDWKQIIK